MATGEVAWLERVQVGQKTEIFVSALHQPFILSPCANDILFSLFSTDETVNFLGCLDCYNKIPQIEWLKQ